MRRFLAFFPLLVLACGSGGINDPGVLSPIPDSLLTSAEFYDTTLSYSWLSNPDTSATLCRRFGTPEGFQRVSVQPGTFASWLRHLPLLPAGTSVLLYDGTLKRRQDVHLAVINIDLDRQDLQQCADALIRLRGEYLYSKKAFDSISFSYTSGDVIPFSRWSAGQRPVVSANSVGWSSGQKKGRDHANFMEYMTNLFNYAGTRSLGHSLKSVPTNTMRIGDFFVDPGSPGHAMIVADMAVNKDGKKVFMLAQSYMPAQQMHIVKNPNDPKLGPWYPVDFTGPLYTPEWTFQHDQLKRFD